MYRIGIDLGGTNIAAGLVNEDFEIIVKDSLPTQATRPPEQIVDDIALLCRRVCDAAGVSAADIEAVGIASPGVANHDSGVVEYANNLPFRHFPIAALLCERFPVKRVSVENDANAAAWGEAVAGAARGTKNSVMITLGTGVGGSNFAGAELGHIVIQHGGRKCSCGRRGCWEAYSSATAMIRMTEEKIAECAASGRETLMTAMVAERGRVTGRTACDAMRQGDAAAREVYDEYINYLACGLTNIVNIFQPQVISLGGGISGEGQSLIDAVSPLVHAEQYGSGIVELADIRIAKLGNDAGIIGAAFLGFDQ